MLADRTGDIYSLGDLMDPDRYSEPLDIEGWEPEILEEMLRLMVLIRRTEDVISEMVETGEAVCPCHLAIGQEACAVGVVSVLDPGRDLFFGAHRSHGHYLAKGGDVEELFAEVLGRQTGCSGGMGGSMHLIDPERGLLGTVPIVAATIPVAAGAALAARMDGNGGVAVTFFGDGAAEEGVFHETLNLASNLKLPVLFICENNLFASHLHISMRQPATSITRFADAHLLPSEMVDGNDVLAVEKAIRAAVERARDGGGAALVELVTYRWKGHVGHREDDDVGVKRSGDLPLWKIRDPIKRLSDGMLAAGIWSEERMSNMDREISGQVAEAIENARQAPYPDLSATMQYLYTENR